MPGATPTPSPLQIIREELPRFLNEPHAADFREVISALVPQSPSELAMEVAFSPISKPARLASLASSALTHSPEAEGAPLSRLARWYDDAVSQILKRRTHDAGEPERLYSMIQDMPHMAEIFSPDAAAELLVRHPDGFVKPLTPGEFRSLATPLPRDQVEPYIEHYKDLLTQQRWVEPPPGLFRDRYLNQMREKGFEGFEDVPRLWYHPAFPDEPNLSGRITGHEGRHRAYAIEDLYGPDVEMPVGFYNQGNTDRVPYFMYPETPDPQDLMYKRSIEMPRRKYANGGLARHIESLGFTPEDTQYAMERFEEEREYLPHRHTTNYESRPERYMIYPPNKIVPKEEWKYGSSVGGTHNFLEGIQVPNRSWNWVLPEVLTHEAQHANVGALPLEEVTSREEAQKSILNKLMEYVRPLHPAKYPAGITGREEIEELAPELIAAEGYLPAGQSLIQSELGRRIFQTPEEKLWYYSRRYPRMRDPEVKGGYLDAITGAAPR